MSSRSFAIENHPIKYRVRADTPMQAVKKIAKKILEDYSNNSRTHTIIIREITRNSNKKTYQYTITKNKISAYKGGGGVKEWATTKIKNIRTKIRTIFLGSKLDQKDILYDKELKDRIEGIIHDYFNKMQDPENIRGFQLKDTSEIHDEVMKTIVDNLKDKLITYDSKIHKYYYIDKSGNKITHDARALKYKGSVIFILYDSNDFENTKRS